MWALRVWIKDDPTRSARAREGRGEVIIEDPRRGITEMDRVRSLVSLSLQCRKPDAAAVDGNAIVRDLTSELERSGPQLPESTRFVMRWAAAQVLMLVREAEK